MQTALHHTVTIREENANAALEVMSRFAVNPKWLFYLPPTMSPSETSARPSMLEHPAEVFAHFRKHGVPTVVCQEKHMGSRAVLIVCRDEEAARKRFGVIDEGIGVVVTRTGRPFFNDGAVASALLERVRVAFEKADLPPIGVRPWLVRGKLFASLSADAHSVGRTDVGLTGLCIR